jgi:NAD(P)-dependent dehydrogenase (short-subunit alcohol dehydrogenase family)
MTIAAIVQPNNVAVVTGAALGIGRAMCKRFAEAGMSVVLADLPGDDLNSAVHTSALSGSALACQTAPKD